MRENITLHYFLFSTLIILKHFFEYNTCYFKECHIKLFFFFTVYCFWFIQLNSSLSKVISSALQYIHILPFTKHVGLCHSEERGHCPNTQIWHGYATLRLSDLLTHFNSLHTHTTHWATVTYLTLWSFCIYLAFNKKQPINGYQKHVIRFNKLIMPTYSGYYS